MQRAQCILAVNYENNINLILMTLYWPPSHVFQTRYSRIAWVQDASGRCLRWVKFSSQGTLFCCSFSLHIEDVPRWSCLMFSDLKPEVGLKIWSLCLFDFLYYFCLRSKCCNLHRARAPWEYRHQGAAMTSLGDVKTTGGLLFL